MSTSKVNMSLDDIIKQNKKGRSEYTHRRGYNNFNRRNFGERRRYANNHSNYINHDKNNNDEQQTTNENDEKRTRLFVSNLQKEVVNSELRVLFISYTSY